MNIMNHINAKYGNERIIRLEQSNKLRENMCNDINRYLYDEKSKRNDFNLNSYCSKYKNLDIQNKCKDISSFFGCLSHINEYSWVYDKLEISYKDIELLGIIDNTKKGYHRNLIEFKYKPFYSEIVKLSIKEKEQYF